MQHTKKQEKGHGPSVYQSTFESLNLLNAFDLLYQLRADLTKAIDTTYHAGGINHRLFHVLREMREKWDSKNLSGVKIRGEPPISRHNKSLKTLCFQAFLSEN